MISAPNRIFGTEPRNQIHSEPNPSFFSKTEPKQNRNFKKSIPHISTCLSYWPSSLSKTCPLSKTSQSSFIDNRIKIFQICLCPDLHRWITLMLMTIIYYTIKCNTADEKITHTNPFRFPPGPIDVLNIKLNSIGSVRSLPVSGDFILYFCIVDAMSSLLKPSIYCHQANAVNQQDCYSLHTGTFCAYHLTIIMTSFTCMMIQ